MKTFLEPESMHKDPAETCLGCGKKTREWLGVSQSPVCGTCAAPYTHTGFRHKESQPCEKCGTRTHWTVDVRSRLAYWCGCSN